MAPRRKSALANADDAGRFESPSLTASTTNLTGFNTPASFGTSSPGPTTRKSTPGTTPGLSYDGDVSIAKGKGKGKRALSSAEESDDELDFLSRPAKRRAPSSEVFIELPGPPSRSRTSSAKGKAVAAQTTSTRTSNFKGKGKAVAPPSDFESESDDEVLESDLSGSEFEVELEGSDVQLDDGSEAEVPLASASSSKARPSLRSAKSTDFVQLSSDLDSDALDSDSDVSPTKSKKKSRSSKHISVFDAAAENDDEEAEDLEAAIRASLASPSKIVERGEAGGSGTGSSRMALAALRAAAAEKRAMNVAGLIVDDGSAYGASSEAIGMSSDDLDSDTDARAGRKQGKGKKGKIPPYTVTNTSQPSSMTLQEMVAKRKAELAANREENAVVKAEERAKKRELGRKLTWAEKSTIALYHHHPELRTTWGDLEADIPVRKPERAPQPPGFKATLLPFQQESVSWMRKQEESVWTGGILADEMGMGKTVQMLALLSTDRRSPNLVVAPTVAIMQWRNEIELYCSDFSVCVWHGGSREKKVADIKKYDVVLTTYAVLESAFRKQEKGFKRGDMQIKEKSAMHQIHWARIILDEAHSIKERTTNTAKATFELKSTYKWCLSGTPLQNRVGELYSVIRFLGGDPFAYYFCKKCDCKSLHWKFSNKKTCDDCGHSPMQHTAFWNNEILTPIQKHALSGPGRLAFKKLKILLDRMMLRRTKVQRADDLGLPPRTVIVRRDYFSPEEKELYLSLFSEAKRQFSTYVDQGILLNNYSNIFSLLTRMRQMACHPDLVLKSRNNPDLAGEIVEASICRICHDVAEDAIKSQCHHLFDRACISQYIDACGTGEPACPVCHVDLTIDLEAPAIEQDEEATKKARQGILGRLNHDTWRSSTKIEALVEELEALRLQDASTKSIVFSQFVNFLDLVAWRLQKAGFQICRLEGTMTPQARDATIKHFMNNVEVTVFLVSLKAGGVALNLTEASRVYLMDSWWNPAVEYQAMDRIHRLGQHRPVHAIKLVVEDSIESRIVQLQEKKSAMVDATLSTDESAMGRLTEEDLGFLFRL